MSTTSVEASKYGENGDKKDNTQEVTIENGKEDEKATQEKRLRYTLEKRPPVSIIIGAGFQHVLMCLPACLAIPSIVADGVCAEFDNPIRTKLFSSTLLMCGICTILETALGIRLPILQGPSSVFLPVILAVQKTDEWKCVDRSTIVNGSSLNSTILSQEERLRQLSGSVMAASLVEILIGGTGLVGLLLRLVGPITVAPVIALIGLSLYKIPIRYSASSWELAMAGAVGVVIFALYLGHIRLPLPSRDTCRRASPRAKRRGIKLCQLLPVLLSILVVWGISALLTVTNVFPDDPDHTRYKARSDAKSRLIELAPWFYVPYPGQFGMPSFNLGIFIGFIAVFFASLIESVGDYFAAAKACEVATPPNHAVNRGIFLEGVGGLISGAVGVGHATTSFSANIAAMTLTRTANRYILICAGIILILFSVIGKFGAVLATIPDPALGGALAVIYGMLVSLGLSTLQFVNLNSARNLLILGLSFFVGILIPEWIDRDPTFINTGSKVADNTLKVALGTPMFLGGLIAIILDNTTPGSRKDRGIDAWQQSNSNEGEADSTDTASTYGWFCQNSLYRVVPWCSKLPVMPPREVTQSYELPSVVPSAS